MSAWIFYLIIFILEIFIVFVLISSSVKVFKHLNVTTNKVLF